MDFGAISEDELKTMPKSLMLKILLSFRSLKDEGWRELQRKAEKILTE